MKNYNVVGPASLDDSYYNIDAKIPPNTSLADVDLMLQRLLVERIGLVIHHESREQTAFELVVGKGGSKLRKAEPADPAGLDPGLPTKMVGHPPVKAIVDKDGSLRFPPGHPALASVSLGGGMQRLMARMEPVEILAAVIEGRIGHPVVNKTGLSGTYDFTIDYVPELLIPAGLFASAVEPDKVDSPGPTILEAVERQLGLKLEPKRINADVLVVDRFNRYPTGN